MLQSITNDSFESEVLKSDIPVLLEFYSDSCIPCKRMSPILAEIEEEFTNIKVSKLNVKFAADTARKYSVMSSPTILFFKNSEEVSRIKGIAKKGDIEAIIKEIVE